MSILKNKIDFVALISVDKANSNGDPLNGNRPRTDYNGFGEISDVCIKRKIRNRMQDLGYKIFVQSDDRADDGYKSLSERAEKVIGKEKNKDVYAKKACEEWMDVRSFGQVFAFKSNNVSVGVRGPVSVHQAVSI
jgi:CRISPR-associated protein Csd2